MGVIKKSFLPVLSQIYSENLFLLGGQSLDHPAGDDDAVTAACTQLGVAAEDFLNPVLPVFQPPGILTADFQPPPCKGHMDRGTALGVKLGRGEFGLEQEIACFAPDAENLG